MSSGILFSKIVIIQSLKTDDVPTGDILREHLASLNHEYQRNIPIEVIDCSSAVEFSKTVDRLIYDAENDSYPLLHVECHGCPQDGLEFSDGSDLGWEQVSEKMTELNRAAELNLVIIFSACFGDYFSYTMGITKAAPCWCVIGPNEKIFPDEILLGLREFYSNFFIDLDIGKAVKGLEECKLSEGKWVYRMIEELFFEICQMYLTNCCTLQAGTARIDDMVKKGKIPQVPEIAKTVLRQMNNSQINEYFNRYFMVTKYEAHRDRFGDSLASVQRLIKDLRASGDYYL
jgi:hypothetical protein